MIRSFAFLTFVFSVLMNTSAFCGSGEVAESEIRERFPEISSELLARSNEGDLESQFQLGEILTGSGEDHFVRHGLAVLERAALKHGMSALSLGFKYGEGVPVRRSSSETARIEQNYEKSIQWLEHYLMALGAKNDVVGAMAVGKLAEVHAQNGNTDTAFQLLSENAQLIKKDSSGFSQFTLAGMYRDGVSTVVDLEKAYEWYSLAADQGLNVAIMERNFLALELGKKADD